jgi:hypothetical protein
MLQPLFSREFRKSLAMYIPAVHEAVPHMNRIPRQFTLGWMFVAITAIAGGLWVYVTWVKRPARPFEPHVNAGRVVRLTAAGRQETLTYSIVYSEQMHEWLYDHGADGSLDEWATGQGSVWYVKGGGYREPNQPPTAEMIKRFQLVDRIVRERAPADAFRRPFPPLDDFNNSYVTIGRFPLGEEFFELFGQFEAEMKVIAPDYLKSP